MVLIREITETISFQVEVDEDPAESKKDEQGDKTEVLLCFAISLDLSTID